MDNLDPSRQDAGEFLDEDDTSQTLPPVNEAEKQYLDDATFPTNSEDQMALLKSREGAMSSTGITTYRRLTYLASLG